MSTNNNAKCAICGKPYRICNTCLEQKTFKPWRTVTDTISHYKIYLAIHSYTVSKNKAQAREELKKCDLTGLDNFNPKIKSVITEIMAEPKKQENVIKNKKKKLEKDILENNKSDEVNTIDE